MNKPTVEEINKLIETAYQSGIATGKSQAGINQLTENILLVIALIISNPLFYFTILFITVLIFYAKGWIP